MAVEDFRAANQSLAIEVISADGQNKPDIATTIARRWFDTEYVDMVIDIPTSGIALPLAAIVKEKNKVMIATTAGTSTFPERPARRTASIGPGTLGRIRTVPPRPS